MKGLSAVADERYRTDKLEGVIKHRSSRETTMVGRGASLDGRLFLGGTDGSNPPPSSGESGELCCLGVDRRQTRIEKGAAASDETLEIGIERDRQGAASVCAAHPGPEESPAQQLCQALGLSGTRTADRRPHHVALIRAHWRRRFSPPSPFRAARSSWRDALISSGATGRERSSGGGHGAADDEANDSETLT